MSKPKDMTPEQEKAWKEKVAACQKAYREANREKVLARGRARTECLVDNYIATVFRMPISEIPADLLVFKREQLQFLRLTKALINELNTRSNLCVK